jgi:hypothetical protein
MGAAGEPCLFHFGVSDESVMTLKSRTSDADPRSIPRLTL